MNTIVTEIAKPLVWRQRTPGLNTRARNLSVDAKDFARRGKSQREDGLKGRAAKRAYREYFRKTVINQTEAFKANWA